MAPFTRYEVKVKPVLQVTVSMNHLLARKKSSSSLQGRRSEAGSIGANKNDKRKLGFGAPHVMPSFPAFGQISLSRPRESAHLADLNYILHYSYYHQHQYQHQHRLL